LISKGLSRPAIYPIIHKNKANKPMTAKLKTLVCCLLIVVCIAPSLASKAQLAANFSGTPLSGCPPLVVQFSDLTTGNPTQWRWDLGNGTISFLQNPSVTYFNPGQYNVKLVVRNSTGADSVVKSQYITVNSLPTVNFTATPTTGCYPLPVQFTDQTLPGSGTIATWEWDFGDGTSSTLQNPLHVYNSGGNFNVTLRVRNSSGCVRTLTRPQLIQINNGVTANFTNTAPNSCNPPANINFQNLSVGTGGISYQWAFGDGGSSTLPAPSHTYTAPGSYTVTLIAVSSSGCRDTIVKPNAITIGSVTGAFTGPAQVCVNKPASFINTSSPAPAGATWFFGDGTSDTGINIIKTYTTPGTYLVTMAASFGACSDTATQSITVLPNPQPNFTSSNPRSCSTPHTVNFTNTSIDGVSYQWDFGDGGTSTLANPSHTYTAFGEYNVTLIATNAFGCTDTLTIERYVRVLPTDVQLANLPGNGCAPLIRNFSTTIATVDPIVSYQWSFGDGGTGTGPFPSHVYTTPGSYTVSVIVVTASGCRDTASFVNGISVGVKPTANFSATPRDACAKTPINFTDLSTGNITQWLWQFGDGTTSVESNPIHTYQDTGFFDVQLIVWNNGCPDSIRFNDYIYIRPPIARFLDTFSCANPWRRTFIDRSIGADQWFWDFGDGNTSTLQNPVHTYADTGTYSVKLRVVNLATGCDNEVTQIIQVMQEKARFFAVDSAICRGSIAVFNAVGNTLANVADFSWDFGDGSTILSGGSVIGASVSHIYPQSGNYNVTLVVTDRVGCKDTLVKPLYMRVNGPVANFAPSVPGSCLNSAIVFTDSSTNDGLNPIQQWIWEYGDGNTDTLTGPPFQHTYTAAGVYTVGLWVTDSKGCRDSVIKASSLIISRPEARFTSPDSVSCPNRPINFVNQSIGPNLTYQWTFGDGGTSTDPNPVHNYAADGNYTVTLAIIDQYGCVDTLRRQAYVTIVSPIADFTLSDTLSICPPLLVQFTNTSTISNTINWDFGDNTSAQIANPSHFYTSAGVYTIRLTVTGPGGCTDFKEKTIRVRGPQGSFTYGPTVGCNPLTINLTASTRDRISFIWDFNDGTTVSTTDSVIQHTYTNAGVYVPKMILVDTAGCQVPITGPDTIQVNMVEARFGQSSNTICDRGSISFSDSSFSNDVIVGYLWDFGDGATSTDPNPVHFYAATGQYFPRLIVTTQTGCRDTLVQPAPLKIVGSPQATVATPPNGCAPLTATFGASLLVADTSAMTWDWNFGNGGSSNLQNPLPQVYSVAGSYTVQLVATNSSGCKDTVATSIEAYLVPTVTAGLDTLICEGRGIAITAGGASSYNWSPAAGLSCTTCASPVATPDSVTNYIVQGTTPQGCSARDTVQVRVKYPFDINVSRGDTLCRGGSVRLFVQSAPGAQGTFSYAWTPATGLSNATSATPLATPTTTTVYRVVATDDRGCFTDTALVPITVYPIPTVNAGNDVTINVGQTTDLVPVLSPDVTNVVWTPTAGIFRTNYPSITVKPPQTTEYTVEVSNPGGCRATDRVTVFVICNGVNVFIPNTFSPNGDGANDVFYPRGSGLFRIKTLRIFNRWGEVVFEKNDFNPNDVTSGWNGTYKGVKLNPDVYVYTAEVVCDNSTILVLKGNVALIL
jgi:gliding motility-associated-like protein